MRTIILRDLESYVELDSTALATTLGGKRKSDASSRSKGS